VGTGAEAVEAGVPATALVELTDHQQQVVGRGGDLGRELGDAVTQGIKLDLRLSGSLVTAGLG